MVKIKLLVLNTISNVPILTLYLHIHNKVMLSDNLKKLTEKRRPALPEFPAKWDITDNYGGPDGLKYLKSRSGVPAARYERMCAAARVWIIHNADRAMRPTAKGNEARKARAKNGPAGAALRARESRCRRGVNHWRWSAPPANPIELVKGFDGAGASGPLLRGICVPSAPNARFLSIRAQFRRAISARCSAALEPGRDGPFCELTFGITRLLRILKFTHYGALLRARLSRRGLRRADVTLIKLSFALGIARTCWCLSLKKFRRGMGTERLSSYSLRRCAASALRGRMLLSVWELHIVPGCREILNAWVAFREMWEYFVKRLWRLTVILVGYTFIACVLHWLYLFFVILWQSLFELQGYHILYISIHKRLSITWHRT